MKNETMITKNECCGKNDLAELQTLPLKIHTMKEIQLSYNEVKKMTVKGMITFTGSNRWNVVPSKNFIRKGNSLLMQQHSAPRPVFHVIGKITNP